jgi:mannose-6-phosphate isomerase
VDLLDGAARSYAWGSRIALAALRGRPTPSPHPEAELWFGAHPGDPATLRTAAGDASLLDVVTSDPIGQLGEATVDAFGERLPFLLKLLAAEEPLSLQAHPSSAQAAEGFARENATGIALDSSVRNYKDSSHKPELVIALTRFDALAGFREPKRTLELFDHLAVPELAPYAEMLAAQPDSSGLRALFTSWITLPQRALDVVLPSVLEGCVVALGSGSGDFVPELRTVLELGEFYPGDGGVLAALLLNRTTLDPGQGLYLDAGNLHAYLRGTAVEIMANSDNVLRGGLTPKHVDVPELLRVLDFEPLDAPVLDPTGDRGTPVVYPTPAPEFTIARLDLTPADTDVTTAVPGSTGPRIVLVTEGDVDLIVDDHTLTVRRGGAAWLAATDPDPVVRTASDTARVFVATVG